MSSTPRQADGSPAELDLVNVATRAAHSGWVWVVVWLLSRLVMFHRWATEQRFIINDVRYYHWQLGQGDYQVVLREYPLPVLWFLDGLRWPSANDVNLYVILFALTMALLDAAFAHWLWRSHSQVAAIYWIVFCFAMGALIWFRYDILPGVVVGAAVLAIARSPRLSGALVAMGAAIKLWPALLITPLLGRDRGSRARTVGFAVVGFGLAFVSFVQAGWTRLVSPLTWQSDRGLQIESVWATPLMLQRAFGEQPSTVAQMSKYNAYELFGPGVEAWQKGASICMALGVLFAIALAVLAFTRPALAPHQRAMACAAIIAVMLVGNKTLSPQYMVWLGAVCAAWLALTPRGRERERPAIACAIALVGAFATEYVYPANYGGIIGARGDQGITMVLALRNLSLVALMVLLVWWVIADHASNKEQSTQREAE